MRERPSTHCGCVLFTALTGAPRPGADRPGPRSPRTCTTRRRGRRGRPVSAGVRCRRGAGAGQAAHGPLSVGRRPGRAALAAARGERVTEVEKSVARGPAAPPPPPPPLPAPEPPTAAAPTRHMAPPAAPPPPAPSRSRRPRHRRLYTATARRRVLAVLAGAVLAALAAGAVVALSAGGGAPTGPLTSAEVRSATAAFARAYSRETRSRWAARSRPTCAASPPATSSAAAPRSSPCTAASRRPVGGQLPPVRPAGVRRRRRPREWTLHGHAPRAARARRHDRLRRRRAPAGRRSG